MNIIGSIFCKTRTVTLTYNQKTDSLSLQFRQGSDVSELVFSGAPIDEIMTFLTLDEITGLEQVLSEIRAIKEKYE